MSDCKTEARAPLVIEERDSLAIIRFNRPATRNPLSLETLHELYQIISTLIRRDDLTSIIFTGTGDVFASGANIRELLTLPPETAQGFARFGQSLMQKIDDAPQLTIAAVNGYCIGGGIDLALACDVRVASPNAVFAHPGARLGIITGWGGTQRLPRLIGAARALEMFATARRLDAHEACIIGLVARVAEPVLDAAYEIVRTFSRA
ncbi:MAG: enoyl-CoA hydratase/isomerase family protein [Pyrinomonadaceae bacterium]